MCVECIPARVMFSEKEKIIRPLFFVFLGVTEGRGLASVFVIKRVTARSLCRAQEPKSGDGIPLAAPCAVCALASKIRSICTLRARPVALLFSFVDLLRQIASEPGVEIDEAVACHRPRQQEDQR